MDLLRDCPMAMLHNSAASASTLFSGSRTRSPMRGDQSVIVPGIFGRFGAANPDLPGNFIGDRGLELQDLVRAPGMSAGAIAGWTARDGSIHCGITGHVDWLQPDLADIQIKRDPAQALLQAYRQHGHGLLDRVGGRFALFAWDAQSRTGIVAGDRFGLIPVYWSRGDDGIGVAPMATWMPQVTGRPLSISDQGIYNYLYFHMVPGPASVFADVNKLMAAHALVFDGNEVEVRRYWEPSFREHDDGPLVESGEQMLGLLSSAVGRLAADADTGAFLSGGLDSSTVAGLLARHRPNPKTYSIGFDADGYDEIAFAKLASERFETDFKTYYVTPEDVLAALPEVAAAYDEPFGNSSALPAYFCARLAAADGRQRLLAGDGGDELFAGNERYQKQRVFERYGAVPGWMRLGLIEPLLNRDWLSGLPIAGKARSYVQQATIPLPDRLQTYNFLNRLGAESIVSEALWRSVDPELPLNLDRAVYGAPREASTLNRMLYLDWQHTLTDNDLRKVNRMCQLAGIEVEYPMLDDHLVEFSTRVSSARKMRGNRLRDFYKRAVVGLLPDQIINKSKHGFGLPFGIWMAEHPGLQALAADNLARMRRRSYVQPEFIDEITRLHREQHAGYYGEFIWVLIMLELWLTSQGIEP